ncbi:NAD(P)-dependent oxidoreductase [Synechococcus elongatus]|uniref:NAD(P)-dependent oxidoreductase n=1 Tax=Synechococcus elongatus PCC 11801 TaxID=2219813 RepID=A0AAN1QQD6_SYNEL|nr:NAD(P)-dependent oxidoreductase [Synechococcus elongatus]AZB73666.1 NAD(P)-dependent oxidoreductase [Synechococcus elongatus PCC 11801]
MRCGLIGTGLLGGAIAERLLAVGQPLTVWNRTVERSQTLANLGAVIAPTPAALLAECEVCLLLLSDAEAIAATLLTEASRSQLVGKTIIQMGTIAPTESRAIADQIAAAGGSYLEAPVLGSLPEARNGTLIVMVGSEPAAFEQWRSLLGQLSPEPQWIGPVGASATLKLALNQLIGSLTSAFGASLALIQRSGLAVEPFMAILRQSALYAPTFDKKLARLLSHQYDNPNFPTTHLAKDLRLFQQTAAELGIATDAVEGVESIVQKAITQGWGDQDYSALYEAIDSDQKD